ncbi:trehalose-6-phosphate synthase [Amycolatopsis mongoliensis]|uniref:Trehalose-6-phosphate synthase n=1 Tax=Amycolatopsis mongoliensis TaxID=715475 RepID=A0A9Y2JQV0_9PSEU|nr:trehalose-6-phosphate synthase [Amycolatopsis sp. 4-36]WIY02215.1 trehalose-6-phosphate synthase [Amycolatopsis sp. 4-36]
MKLLTLSNSCPRWDDGGLLPRSPGGLVPMLIALLSEHGGHWVFTAPPGSPPAGSVSLNGGVRLHPLDLAEDVRQQHYDTVSIGLLLGLLHYLHDTSRQPVVDSDMVDAWTGYEAVNRTYANRLGELAGNSADELVLINDPHLMLVPEFYAAQGERANRLAYFLGTPWCEPDYFSILPAWMRTKLLESLLQCDVVGFHAGRWVDAFLACCRRYLPDVTIDGWTVGHRGRTTRMVAVPFPLDVDAVERVRREPATARWQGRLAELAGGRRILTRADRLDLWKNMTRGFLAYEAMLERRPELAGECWFASIATVPSRAAARHDAYRVENEAIVRRINERFGSPDREAVSLIYPGTGGDSRNSVIAALGMCDAALVNSTYDGLNLFAKEAALLLPDSASLLLSENAGVYEQLGRFAVPIDPFDIGGTSTAMEAALGGRSTRADGAAGRRTLLRAESAGRWLEAVFAPAGFPGATGQLGIAV